MDAAVFNTKWNKHTLRGFSIQQRLPLLICILLLSVMISFSLISYLGVRKSALNIGKERLNVLSGQLSSMLAQSAEKIIGDTRGVGNHPAIIEAIKSAGTVLPDEAVERVRQLRRDSTTMLIELWDANKKSLLRWGKDSVQYRVNFNSLLSPEKIDADTGRVGNIYKLRDSLYFPAIVSINEEGKKIGYIVRWFLLKSSPEAIESLSQLIGVRSHLYIGNTDKTIWTDMRSQVSISSVIDTTRSGKIVSYKNENGERVLGISQPIARSSWLVLIEFSESAVLEAATRFMQWLILIGGIILLVGIFFAWIMSRNITRPLNRLTRAATTIAGGDYSAPVDINRRDEVGKLARALNAMAMQVGNAKSELEKKIGETQEMNNQLRSLSAHLQNIREDERIHIAREMHDELGQLLTGFKMDVAWVRKRLNTQADMDQVEERLKSMTDAVDEAVKFVRKLAAELRPSLLDDVGIVPALEWYSQEFQKRFTINVDFKSSVGELVIPNEQATGLFRIYQESLTNVARHAKASAIIASFGIQGERLTLSVIDNGRGFEINSKGKLKTLGLLGMKERAGMIGGNLEISSTPGKGTRVYITVPLSSPVN